MKTIFERKLHSKVKPFYGRPDLTALIDIFFLMLIFMLISSPFVQVSGIEVDLPRVPHVTGRAGLERFIVTIVTPPDGKEQIYFNDQPITMAELPEALAKVSEQTSMNMVIIRADSATRYDVFTEIIAIASSFHLGTFIATNSPLADDSEGPMNVVP